MTSWKGRAARKAGVELAGSDGVDRSAEHVQDVECAWVQLRSARSIFRRFSPVAPGSVEDGSHKREAHECKELPDVGVGRNDVVAIHDGQGTQMVSNSEGDGQGAEVDLLLGIIEIREVTLLARIMPMPTARSQIPS